MKNVAVIGAGILGLSTGIEILKNGNGIAVEIFEKEFRPGTHASGRNSGVIHAGFYYSPDSLKAKFCKDGNIALTKLCQKHGIPIRNVGKVVVAKDSQESDRLNQLYERGKANGVEVHLYEAGRLVEFEPLAQTYENFLWSPSTSISDPNLVTEILKNEFLELGGVIRYNENVNIVEKDSIITIDGSSISFNHIVNCAGAHSDRLARQVGLAKKYRVLPFKGAYYATSITNLPLRTLVYPVPHPINPFLGTHFTLTLDNKLKIGPTAMPVLGRENYSGIFDWNLTDTNEVLTGLGSLIRGEKHKLSEILRSEVPKLRKKKLLEQGIALIPSSINLSQKNWMKKPPGIRGQLINIETGELEQDFVIEEKLNSTHVLNLVSPGWTSALSFSSWLVREKILPRL